MIRYWSRFWKSLFFEFNFSIDGGESNAECQTRAIKVLKELLDTFKNKKK